MWNIIGDFISSNFVKLIKFLVCVFFLCITFIAIYFIVTESPISKYNLPSFCIIEMESDNFTVTKSKLIIYNNMGEDDQIKLLFEGNFDKDSLKDYSEIFLKFKLNKKSKAILNILPLDLEIVLDTSKVDSVLYTEKSIYYEKENILRSEFRIDEIYTINIHISNNLNCHKFECEIMFTTDFFKFDLSDLATQINLKGNNFKNTLERIDYFDNYFLYPYSYKFNIPHDTLVVDSIIHRVFSSKDNLNKVTQEGFYVLGTFNIMGTFSKSTESFINVMISILIGIFGFLISELLHIMRDIIKENKEQKIKKNQLKKEFKYPISFIRTKKSRHK